MTRLALERQRLYGLPLEATTPPGAAWTRAAALVLSAPADWEALSALWRGVQTDLEWPAPAIAVSGDIGLQLWFSFAQPLPVHEARAAVAALQAHYLPGVKPARVTLSPSAEGPPLPWPPHLVKADLGEPQWSAFVAPDLAPVFADTPWLDTEPNPDGQADLLARLRSISPAQWQAAQAILAGWRGDGGAADAHPTPGADTVAHMASPTAERAPATPATDPPNATYPTEPRAFLRAVMNDPGVALALRIEAAKALL